MDNKKTLSIIFIILLLLSTFSVVLASSSFAQSDLEKTTKEKLLEKDYQKDLRNTDKFKEKIDDKLRSYDSSEKRLILEEKNNKLIIDLKLLSDYDERVGIGNDTRVHDFEILDFKNKDFNLSSGYKAYSIKDNYTKVEKEFTLKYQTITVETNCYEVLDNVTLKNKTECHDYDNITWTEFQLLSELPKKNINYSVFVDTKEGEHIEIVYNYDGYEAIEYASYLVTGLTTYYKLDEEAGVIYDEVGTSNGTNIGSTNTTGKIKYGYTFDGSNDYIDTNIGTLTGDFSLSAWFYPTTLNDHNVILSQAVTSAGHFRIHINVYNGKLQVRQDRVTTGVSMVGDTTITTNQWHHVVVTSDQNGDVIAYLDGEHEINTTGNTNNYYSVANAYDLTIGTYYRTSGIRWFTGKIDEVAVYDGTIVSSTGASDLYTNGINNVSYPFEAEAESTLLVNLTNPTDDTNSESLSQIFNFTPIASLGFSKAELWVAKNVTSEEYSFNTGVQIISEGSSRTKRPHLAYVNDSSGEKALFLPNIGDSDTNSGGVFYCEGNNSQSSYFNTCSKIIFHNAGSYKRGSPSLDIADLDNDGYIDIVAGMEDSFVSVVYGNSSNSPPFNSQVNSSSITSMETDYVTVGKSSSDTLYDIFVLTEDPKVMHFIANNSKTGFKYDTAVEIGSLSGTDASEITTAYVSNTTRVDVFAMSETGYIYRCGYNDTEADDYNTCTIIAQTKYDMNSLVIGFGEGTGFRTTNRTSDVNGDNIPDIFLASANETFIILSNESESDYYNNKTILKEDWAGVTWLQGSDIIDWDKDGMVDWVVSDYYGDLWVFIQNQSEEDYFNEPISIGNTSVRFGIVIDDINGDDVWDVVSTGNYTSVPDRGTYTNIGQEDFISVWSGWINVSSNSSSVVNNTNNSILYSLDETGDYVWNIKVYDNDTNDAFATSNYTITISESNSAPILTANVTSPDLIYENTDWLINITASDTDDNYLSTYTQFYVNDTKIGGLQYYNLTNNTNSLIATLSSSNFETLDNLTAEIILGDDTINNSAVNLTGEVGQDNLTCWFNPTYQDEGVRDVWCNLTTFDGETVLNANISHSTYDTNDWYKNGLMSDKGWFIGYQSVPNAFNFSANNYTIYGSATIDSVKRGQIRYGDFTYPFNHLSQNFSILLKAGSEATTLRVMICNDTYYEDISGNTPINLTRTSLYSGCQLAGTINATAQGINYNNWTWGTVDVTESYNNITKDQTGLNSYSIHLSSYDASAINPVGWSAGDEWIPPLHNETVEVFSLLNNSFNSTNNFFYPNDAVHDNSSAWVTQNVLNVSNTITFNATTGFPIFDSDDDFMTPLNLSSWEEISGTNASFTNCMYFKRSESGTATKRLEKWNNPASNGAMSLYIKLNDITFWIREKVDAGCGYKRINTVGDLVADTNWHHVCGVVDRENGEMYIVLDGEKVGSLGVTGTCEIRDVVEVVYGRDTPDKGSDDGFEGQLAHYMLHNDSHTAGEIKEGINSAWWSLALGEQVTDNVYAIGELINNTTYYWEDEPGHTPIAFTKIYNINNDTVKMTYNVTNGLYHSTYYTNPSQFTTSQGSVGVNFTTLFESEKATSTNYWYVAGESNATCEISVNWNDVSEMGQYQLARINWTINSSIPLSKRNMYICEEGYSSLSECDIYTGDSTTRHKRFKEYGTATVVCEVQNDFMSEPAYSNDTLDIGCWSSYNKYDGTEPSLELESDLTVCPGTHTMISALDDSVIKNSGEYSMSLMGETIFDGGNNRGNHSNSSDYRMMLWGYNLNNRQQNPNGNLIIQNGDIGFYFEGDINNSYFANYKFNNMSIAFDLEHNSANNFSIINNTFTNCGVGGEDTIYIVGSNVTIKHNYFNELAEDGDINVYCDDCSNVTLEQNYYWDVTDLDIYSEGNIREASTVIGNFSCEIGETGDEYPYSNSTTYPNNASLYGEIVDSYPCTTKGSSINTTITVLSPLPSIDQNANPVLFSALTDKASDCLITIDNLNYSLTTVDNLTFELRKDMTTGIHSFYFTCNASINNTNQTAVNSFNFYSSGSASSSTGGTISSSATVEAITLNSINISVSVDYYLYDFKNILYVELFDEQGELVDVDSFEVKVKTNVENFKKTYKTDTGRYSTEITLLDRTNGTVTFEVIAKQGIKELTKEFSIEVKDSTNAERLKNSVEVTKDNAVTFVKNNLLLCLFGSLAIVLSLIFVSSIRGMTPSFSKK